MRRYATGCAVYGLLLAAFNGHAAEYVVDPAESVFAVVVHKAGMAARFAHNHLVYPGEFTASLSIEGTDLSTAKFDLKFPVAKLVVDAPEGHERWYPRIEKAGILDKPFSRLDAGDRKTIADHMLAKDQLDAEQFPDVSAKVAAVRAAPTTQGRQNYTHLASVEFTVHGKTVKRDCPVSIAMSGGNVTIDAIGLFKFSEFGIKPYSAMLGAVRNSDEFHVFVHAVAHAQS